MFTQLFGNYLLRKGVVTPDQLVSAIKASCESHVKLGTLCIHAGIMSASEVEKVYILQTHRDARFGEIAIEEGYITPSQLEDVMEDQSPHYLVLAQELIERGIITHDELEKLLGEYNKETGLNDINVLNEQRDQLHTLVENFIHQSNISRDNVIIDYIQLLFNDLIRFIGDDFTPLNLIPFNDYKNVVCATQEIEGHYNISTAVDMSEATAIEFAKRYAGETFTQFDEYVSASLEDFLNLHNGLFLINVSNSENIELKLMPPLSIGKGDLKQSDNIYLLPLSYTFGTVNFLIGIND